MSVWGAIYSPICTIFKTFVSLRDGSDFRRIQRDLIPEPKNKALECLARGINWLLPGWNMQEPRSTFEKIFIPHLAAAYNLARWIVENEQDAQDLVQEAYIKALKGFPKFNGRNPRAWLLTIVRNTAYDYVKKHSKKNSYLITKRSMRY
ncbi:MAG: sigma-70 family RNA polymerase sigma factor [Verrucomicrobia bacterium]|nr:sigma-70 family RNA polymerase sigma factor [Verrucomicrobiota bacterium]